MREIRFLSEKKDGFVIKTAELAAERYYFKIPEKYENELTGAADPFVILLIFTMMREGGNFNIKGAVSKSLLDNLELFAAYWKKLIPQLYKEITITADKEIEDEPVRLNGKAIACFSGGIDSAFMLYRHKKGLAGRNNRDITKCIFLAGADIALNEKKRFKDSFELAEKMCVELGAELIPVEMNYRYYPHNWEMEHMTFMVSALRLWKDYPYQMIGSSGTVGKFTYPWGTNPVTDHLLSSNNFKVSVDDMDFNRMEKTAFIKDWKTCIDNLRVCWDGGADGKMTNCGVCEKCMRTYLNFRALGVKDLSCMAEKFDAGNFKNLLFGGKTKYYYEPLNYAIKNGTYDAAFAKLAKILKKNERKESRKKFEYYRSYLLSKISFGRKKKHYLNKMKKIKEGKDHTELLCLKQEPVNL